MPEYAIAPRELSDAATDPAQLTWVDKIRRSNGIRRNTAALNPNDAIELSKVTMTNLRAAQARSCRATWAPPSRQSARATAVS
jgi:hypothetical protein